MIELDLSGSDCVYFSIRALMYQFMPFWCQFDYLFALVLRSKEKTRSWGEARKTEKGSGRVCQDVGSMSHN